MSEFAAKKSLGQHWLDDKAALTAMLAAAEVGPDDTVLEIGPGLGSLTSRLVKTAAKVIAVEKDEALAANLKKSLQEHKSLSTKVSPRESGKDGVESNLQVVRRDILQFDFTSLPPDYKLVANIPYYLTSNLIRVISETSNPPTTAVLLVQKEVAERLAAEPGDMSILAVTAQFYWQVSLDRVVKAELFEPPPKVDSRIVKLARRQQPLFDVDQKQFFHLVKAGFSQKRKTLVNNLAASYQLDKKVGASTLEKAGISPSARAQTLALTDWNNLLKALPKT